MLASSITCFAEWPKHDDPEFLKARGNKFYIPMSQSQTGVHIAAVDESGNYTVQMRYSNGFVDYIIDVLEAKNEGVVFLELLDESGFEIASVKVGGVTKQFAGAKRGKFQIFWEKFKDIKKFDVSLCKN